MKLGDKVKAKRDIWHEADDHAPNYLLCERGEVLIVRSVSSEFFDVYVSHPEITDNSFGVHACEIELIEESAS